MKHILQLMILAGMVCVTAVAEDELDAALAAQKKKAHRRTYSSSAILHNRNLLVPTGMTDEEKSLDAKIRALDKKMDGGSIGMDQRAVTPRPTSQRPRQEESNNWLTPALLDDDAAENGPADQEVTSWVTLELDRQKLIQLEKTALKENTDLVNQQLRGGSRPAEGSQYDPLQSYDSALKNILSGSMPDTRRRTSTVTPLTPPKKTTFGVSTFSSIDRSTPTTPGAFSSSIKQPQRVTQFGVLPSQGPTKSTSIWDTPSSEPLPPLKRLRQRSPLKTDPFTEDYMPKTKRSIWD